MEAHFTSSRESSTVAPKGSWQFCARQHGEPLRSHYSRPDDVLFMIFEITQDYQIPVPLMVANLLSFVISKRYQPVPVYHALLHQDGVHLPSPASFSVEGTLFGKARPGTPLQPLGVRAESLPPERRWD
jgi:hypothetical protein